MYFLDGLGGPALTPGWQRYSDAENEADIWYVCVIPPYLTDTPPPPQWDPPYAPLPGMLQTPPYHPRINPLDKFVTLEDGSKCYMDPVSGEPLKVGWRAITDGVELWYVSRGQKPLWVAPLYSP